MDKEKVAPQKIILFPSTRIPSQTENPLEIFIKNLSQLLALLCNQKEAHLHTGTVQDRKESDFTTYLT